MPHLFPIPAKGNGVNLRTLTPRAGLAVPRGSVLISALAVAGLVLAGCSSDSDGEAPAPGVSDNGGDSTNSTGAGDSDGSGRVFGASDDAVVQAVVKATPADSAEWRGDTLWVNFDDGSVKGPTTGGYCRITAALLNDGESVMLVYPDGEVDCEQEE